jgi:uncharacterized repeat protein (TIGR03803 family)
MIASALVMLLLVIAAQPAQAQTYTVLHTFSSGSDGSGPNVPSSPLVRNSAGDVFGTTTYGGSLRCHLGCGVFFKLSNSGGETILHAFTDKPDGRAPVGPIVRDAAGNFYGTTYLGGASNSGALYRMDKAGNITVLYSFHQYPGQYPIDGVVLDSAGNIYGTTSQGGATRGGYGVVFKFDTTGKYTVLHRFTGGQDGAYPSGALVRDLLGNLYGEIGTDNITATCCGAVFKINSKGVKTVLHNFTGMPEGVGPIGGLIRDSAGNFYGATGSGGAANHGTIFKMTATGATATLYSFLGDSDGDNPRGPLVRDSAGNLYGITANGGDMSCPTGCGTVFKLDPSGVKAILHNFAGVPDDGYEPAVTFGLTLGADGNLYGSAQGGAQQAGILFKIEP